MARRTKSSSLSRSSTRNGNGPSREEVSRTDLPGVPYAIIVYDTWESDVPKDDPATSLERRMAAFQKDVVPPEGELPWEDDYYDHGLKGAISDVLVEVLREADKEAQRLIQEEKQLFEVGRRYNYGKQEYEEGVSPYEKFLDAIETVHGEPENEEAWAVIAEWRQRQMRDEDKAARL